VKKPPRGCLLSSRAKGTLNLACAFAGSRWAMCEAKHMFPLPSESLADRLSRTEGFSPNAGSSSQQPPSATSAITPAARLCADRLAAGWPCAVADARSPRPQRRPKRGEKVGRIRLHENRLLGFSLSYSELFLVTLGFAFLSSPCCRQSGRTGSRPPNTLRRESIYPNSPHLRHPTCTENAFSCPAGSSLDSLPRGSRY